jgi:esterase/lipase
MKHARGNPEAAFWHTGEIVSLSSKRSLRKWWSAKKKLLFLHGWESRGSAFFKVIPIFVSAGFEVFAWDGPGHGDSPGRSTHLPDYVEKLKIDLLEVNQDFYGVIGHSFGGASLSLLLGRDFCPKKVVIIAAPAYIKNIFTKFCENLSLSIEAQEKLFQVAHQKTGHSTESVSLINHDLSLLSRVLVIHDCFDKEISVQEFYDLQKKWEGGEFLETKKLGHRRIIREKALALEITQFLN